MNILPNVFESDLKTVVANAHKIDYLIIGSGTAGITSAIELAQAGHCVVVLDAGDFVMLEHVGSSPLRTQGHLVEALERSVISPTSWVPMSEYAGNQQKGALRHNNQAWYAIGGRTLFWGGLTPRFNQHDFHDWPFDYQAFAPYYEKAEALIGTSPYHHQRQPFIHNKTEDGAIEQLKQAGVMAQHPPLGINTERVENGHMSNGFDSSISRLVRSGLLKKFDGHPGIAIVSDTVSISLIKHQHCIECVQVWDRKENRHHDIAAKHVILAGGAIQSTRLALASGIVDESPQAGHYINDHLFIQGLIKLQQPLDEAFYLFVPATSEQPYQFQIQGPFHETWYSPNYATVWLDWEKGGHYLLLYGFGVGSVEESNHVELISNQHDTLGGMENYAVVYDHSSADKETLTQMQKSAEEIAGLLGGEVLRCQVNEPGKALHEMGGLRMGKDRETSVTNPYGQFWDIQNLSVADASCWPSQGAANSYLSITATSLRHAEALLRTH